ncbi:MAG TPA: hypothetical protein VFS60_14720 [Thermoanaerobaculia bacterium]|nr:hypothetical protein [Thermoanaerobaculia bacterium]
MHGRLNLGGRRPRAAMLAALLGAVFATASATTAWAGETTFAGTIFTDVTSRENHDDATNTDDARSGFGFDLTRFYSTVIYKHDDRWSANFTVDVCDKVTVVTAVPNATGGTTNVTSSKSARCEVFIKKAYIQGHFSDPVNFRIGSADLAWVPYIEADNRYRYIEPVLIDHFGFGSSTDWGLHYYGRLGIVNYQFSAVNGGTYNEASNFRSKSVDFEGRLAVEPFAGVKVAIGGYKGKRGQEVDVPPGSTARFQDATRFNAMASYTHPRFRIGGEWFKAEDWVNTRYTAPAAGRPTPSDEAEGWSVWGAFVISPTLEVIGRYDELEANKEFGRFNNPTAFNPGKLGPEGNYSHVGIQYQINSAFVATLAWKHIEAENGRLPSVNVGSTNTALANGGDLNEIGIWSQFKW